jgi:sugar-specific transcriptional regulator TrmB
MTLKQQSANNSLFEGSSGTGAMGAFQSRAYEKTFIAQLTEFGLREKEARIYFYLLKHGAKSVTELAKFAKTYREDVYRRLDALLQEGLVEQSLEKPTEYAAVPLQAALDAIMQKHTYAWRQMEIARTELLQQVDAAQLARGAVDTPGCRLVKGVHEVLAVGSRMIAESESTFAMVLRPQALPKLAHFGLIDEWKQAALRGTRIRIITDAIPANLAALNELKGTIEVRCYEDYAGVFFWVIDEKETVTVLATARDRAPLTHSAFWTNSPEYAGYLTSFFELIWEQSIAVEERIKAVSSRVRSQTRERIFLQCYTEAIARRRSRLKVVSSRVKSQTRKRRSAARD